MLFRSLIEDTTRQLTDVWVHSVLDADIYQINVGSYRGMREYEKCKPE